MTAESNKDVVRQLFIELDPRTARGALADVLADDVLLPADTLPNGRQGLAGMEEHLEFMGSRVEIAFDIIDMVAEGDTVAVRARARMKILAEFFGFSPDGREIDIEQVQFLRIENGKISEVWRLNDVAGMMQQLTA
ncbi:ester cyclase [Microbacterium sp. Leaf288]|uniref:ester cyclase n=1 Tax=Microbacterium sp. Leaf288 TaxID=1736323 RepID=UPI00138F6E77|nr:ester cyclase [Microbacterium sp. Leaf288]